VSVVVYIATTWLSAANFVANVGGINLHAGVLLPKHFCLFLYFAIT
jgi:hypothetical protein